jgi:hypothetical protein
VRQSSRQLHQKLALSPERRNILVNAPPTAVATLGMPRDTFLKRLSGKFDYIHLFVTKEDDLHERLPRLKRHLAQAGTLWVSWPKGRKSDSELSLRDVIRLAYDAGLVESKTIAFDETWSAIKLTLPKPGKTYHNSYGRLRTAGSGA